MIEIVELPGHMDLVHLSRRLDGLRERLAAATTSGDTRLAEVHPRHRASAENLLHYLAMRRQDMRDLQAALAALGPSSLGRADAHFLATIDAVRLAVASIAGLPTPPQEQTPTDLFSGDDLLEDLAGPRPRTGPVAPGPQVLHLRPRRDPLGRPTEPARIRLTAPGSPDVPDAANGPEGSGPARVPVHDPGWLSPASTASASR